MPARLPRILRRTLAVAMSIAMVLSTTQVMAFAETTLATDSNAAIAAEDDGVVKGTIHANVI